MKTATFGATALPREVASVRTTSHILASKFGITESVTLQTAYQVAIYMITTIVAIAYYLTRHVFEIIKGGTRKETEEYGHIPERENGEKAVDNDALEEESKKIAEEIVVLERRNKEMTEENEALERENEEREKKKKEIQKEIWRLQRNIGVLKGVRTHWRNKRSGRR
jgi:predicted RNase H-like nuclease (RuvC/YqgF family)